MTEYPILIYYKDEKEFDSPVKSFIATNKPKKFELKVLASKTRREELFAGIVSIFSDTPSVILGTVKDTDNNLASWLSVDRDAPSDLSNDKQTGFFYGAETKFHYQNKGLSTILRSLLTQAFEAKYKLIHKNKIVGDILKKNTASLKARFFMKNPETGKFYYTTVTGEYKNDLGEELYIVTTDLTIESDLETQKKLFEQFVILQEE